MPPRADGRQRREHGVVQVQQRLGVAVAAGLEHVQILEGRSNRLTLWSHLIRLERADDELTFVTDQVELDAGRLNSLAVPLAGLYLKEQQLRRRLAMTVGRHAL